MYKLYDEDNNYMRWVARKEEAEYFVKFYGWTAKFFKQIKKEKEMLKQMEESPI